jgi:hypothetical protein
MWISTDDPIFTVRPITVEPVDVQVNKVVAVESAADEKNRVDGIDKSNGL